MSDISYRFDLGLISVENFLIAASSAVPYHCFHSDFAFDPVEESTLYDPADIPVSLPFCEINVVAPSEEAEVYNFESRDQATGVENLKVSKDDTLIVDNIVVSSDHFQEFTSPKTHSSLPEINQEDSVRKDFTFNVIWPSTLASNSHLSNHNTDENQTLLQLNKEAESVIQQIKVEFSNNVVCLDRPC